MMYRVKTFSDEKNIHDKECYDIVEAVNYAQKCGKDYNCLDCAIIYNKVEKGDLQGGIQIPITGWNIIGSIDF